jgi:hypothetical protein
VSVNFTPEICINNTSSNSRLTAAGRWATASDSHSQNCLQTLFFLRSFNETTIELQLHAEKLTETVLHLNLGHFGVFFCCSILFCFVLFVFFPPLMRQWQNYFWNTISRIGGWGTNTKIIKTETLLHLNLEISFQSSLCLFNAFLAYCWLVHYPSLLISLKLLFVCFVFYLFICFSLFL